MRDERSIKDQLTSIQKVEAKLALKKQLLVEKAMIHGTDPNDLMKAHEVFNVDQRVNVDRKAYIVDPYQFQSFLGYREKPYSLTYGILRRISYSVPIIRSIIGTRIEQVLEFCEPVKDKYSTGFRIRKKRSYFYDDVSEKLSKEDRIIIDHITEFLLNCGINNTFECDDFDSFVRKIMNDSYTFDQMTFEVVSDRRGRPVEFYAVDAATIRIADTLDKYKDYHELGNINQDKNYNKSGYNPQNNNNINRQLKMGYYPSYCQIENHIVSADFYPWELCFGLRNPQSNIYANGYGVAEIEVLMNTITSMIWGDEYNRRFFSQGGSPKGFFKIKPGTSISEPKLQQFRREYQNMASGVYNSHKTMVLEGDIDWIDLQKSNRDMEFSHWSEYLIKLSCAIYKIDPSEIGFPMSGSSEQKPMFEGNNEARLKESKDKGLYPALKFLERKINKYIVKRINPNFEFEFVGLNAMTPGEELDMDVKMMANFMTVDEIRTKRGLKPLGEEKGGNVIANSAVMQSLMQAAQQKQMEQQQQQGGGQGGGEDEEQENPYGGQEEDEEGQGGVQEEQENPFEKAFQSYLETDLAA